MRGLQERRVAPPLTGSGPAEGRRATGAWRRLVITLSVAAIVVAADQITKTWAVHRLSRGPIHVVWKLDLSLSFNSGAAFGLAQGWAPVLAALAVLIVVGLLVGLRGVRSRAMAVAVGLVVGGAIGNLADRLFRAHHGAVVDFIELHFWPTFNVADSCITIGVILAALLLWRGQAGSASGPGHLGRR